MRLFLIGEITMEKLKIVIPDAKTITNGDLSFDRFSDFGDVTVYPLSSADTLAQRFEKADIVLCNKTPMNEKTLAKAKNLRYIGLFATGYNNIDLDFTKSRGITVCNAAAYSTDAVAQHTFALILEYYSRAADYNAFVQRGGWKESDIFSPFVYPTMELAGKTMGIIGYGSIGKAVAKIALAFNMRVLFCSRNKKEGEGGAVQVALEELVSRSDIVTVHCPLNRDSERMFNDGLFSKFKKGAFFVNTSRGGTVDEGALRRALESGILSGAAVDVIEKEPMSEECVLQNVPGLMITPHIAWGPKETRERCVSIVYDNLKAFLEGKPVNIVG